MLEQGLALLLGENPGSEQVLPHQGLKLEDRQLLDKITAMIQTGESEKLPIIRMLLKNYTPPESPESKPPGEKHEGQEKATKKSSQHRGRAA